MLAAKTRPLAVVRFRLLTRNGGQKRDRNNSIAYGDDGRSACYCDKLPPPRGQYYGGDDVRTELTAKRIELIKEMVPNLSRLALLHNMGKIQLLHPNGKRQRGRPAR